jgi:hypothetical protein
MQALMKALGGNSLERVSPKPSSETFVIAAISKGNHREAKLSKEG